MVTSSKGVELGHSKVRIFFIENKYFLFTLCSSLMLLKKIANFLRF